MGDNGDEAVDFGGRGGGTLMKAAQNVIDNPRRGLHLNRTHTLGLFLRDVSLRLAAMLFSSRVILLTSFSPISC
jgi:hypothetical protein